MLSLDYYARKYGTDKSSAEHNYCVIYEQYLNPYKDKAFKLLELGVKDGASLRMWRDYFKQAQVIGIDTNPACVFSEPRITVCTGSQADTAFLDTVCRTYGKFDVVIDDASHRWDYTIVSLETLLPLVVPGGFYIIEDIECSYWESYRGGVETTVGRLQRLVTDLVGQPGRSRSEYFNIIDSICFYQNICFIKRSGTE